MSITDKIDKYLSERSAGLEQRGKVWPIPEAEISELFADYLSDWEDDNWKQSQFNSHYKVLDKIVDKLVTNLNKPDNIKKFARAGENGAKKVIKPIILDTFKSLRSKQAKELFNLFKTDRNFQENLLDYLFQSYDYYKFIKD